MSSASPLSRVLRGLGLAAAAILLASCGDSPTQPRGGEAIPSGKGRLVVYAQTNQITTGTLVVQVSGPGIIKSDGVTPDTLAFNIPLANGVATGSITVPAGPARVITVRMFNGLTETHRGTVTMDIAEGTNPSVNVTLVPLVGDLPITVTFGTTIVIVRPLIATMAVGDTLRLSAEIRDQNGALVTGKVRWATLQPARATVDTAGLVTMRDTGDVQIVATYGTVGGAAKLTGTPVTSAVSYHLTWNGSVSRAWSDPQNWTPHGIGAQRAPTMSDSVVVTAGPANQPRIESCADVMVRDLVLETGASLGSTCGYSLNVYRRIVSNGTMGASVILRPGARVAGTYANLYVRGDTVALTDSVRTSMLQLDDVGPVDLALAGHKLVTGNLNVYTGTMTMVNGDTLVVNGNVYWNGGDETSKLTGGVVLFRGNDFNGYRYRASGANRLVFDKTTAGQQSISGIDYYSDPSRGALAKWDIRNRDGVRICSQVSVADSVTITSTGTPLIVDNSSCGGYGVRAFGPVVTSANTQVNGYLWELRDTTGTSRVAGTWAPSYTDFAVSGAVVNPALTYANLRVLSAAVKLSGPTTLSNSLWVDGSGADLQLNGQKLTIAGALDTRNGGLLTMLNAADTVLVGGNATFNNDVRAAEATRLVAGLLQVGGNFYAYGFNSGGTHTVRFTAPASANAYVNGMSYSYYSHAFQNMEIAPNASIGLSCSNGLVRGTLLVRSGASLIDNNNCNNSMRVEGDLVTEATSNVHPYQMVLANATGTSKVSGAWSPTYTDFTVADAPVKAGLAYAHLRFYASNHLLGATTATGQVWVDGTGVDLNLSGQALAIGSFLTVQNSATITMQNAADSLDVADYASFNNDMSATEVNRLTAGVMRIGGYLYGYGFSASGTHRVLMTGTASGNHYVSGINYYYRPTQGFQNLEFVAGASYYLCEQPRVKGTLRLRTGAMVQDSPNCWQPTLRTDGDLVTEAGSTLKPFSVALFNSTGTQNVLGTFAPTWTSLNGAVSASQLKPGLTYTNMSVAVPIVLQDSLTVNGDLTIAGVNANVALNGKRLRVMGTLNFDDNATLTMTNPLDSLVAEGRVYWDGGGSESGKLTAGVTVMRGDIFNGCNYYGTGAHRTVFDRATSTVRIDCVNGYTPTQQPFAQVDVRGMGITLNCAMYASGKVRVFTGAKVDQNCYTGTLTVQDTLFVASGSAVTNGPGFPGNNALYVALLDSSGTSQVSGTYNPSATFFQGLHAAINPSLGYRYVRVDRSTGFQGNTVIDGQLDVINDGTILTMGGHTVEVRGTMNFDNQSSLRMDNGADTLLVATGDPTADVYWDGADNVGLLTKGVLKFYGDRFYAPMYHASGTNRVVFASNASGTPISLEGTPTFAKMDMVGTRGVSVNGRLTVSDSLTIATPAVLTGTDYMVVSGVLSTVAGSDVSMPRVYLDDSSGTSNVLGRFRPTYTDLRSAISRANALKPNLEYQNLTIEGSYAMIDSMSLAGSLEISGANGELRMDGHRMRVAGSVELWNGGNLRMRDEASRDTLIVLGDHMRFQNGSGASTLQYGVIRIAGNYFAIDHDSVNATGNHRVEMNGTGTGTQTLYLNSNGYRRLQNLDITGTRNVQFYYGGRVNGTMNVSTPVTVSSSGPVHIEGALTSTSGSSLNFTNVLELNDATGTANVGGNLSETYITRFLSGPQTIASRAGITYTHMEIGGAGTVTGSPLALGGNLTLTSSSSSLTLPAGSTINGYVNTYGSLTFAGSATATYDLTVQAGGSTVASGLGSTDAVDFRSINLNSPSGATPGGTMNNSVGTSTQGFRRATTGSFNNWNLGNATGGGLTGPVPATHP